jgi:hypothetical protein
MVARVIAILGVVIGALLLLATAGGDTEVGFTIAVSVYLVVCVLVVVLTFGLARYAIDGYPDHLEVRSGFGSWRTVPASEIVAIRTEASRWTGFSGRDARRWKLFATFAVYAGFRELCDWLAQRAPEAWTAYTAPDPTAGSAKR